MCQFEVDKGEKSLIFQVHVVKTYRLVGAEVQLHSLLTSELDGDEGSS